MTVLLVLLTICVFIGIDALHQYKAKHAADAHVPDDVYVHDWGISMADGGQKIEEKKESK